MPECVSGPPPLMQPGAALGSLAARFCWQGQHFRLWTVPERVSGPPPLMLPGAALGSLAARFCWQGQRFRLWTVPERVSGPPPLDAARRSTWEPRGSFLLLLAARFCWQGQHFRLWTVPERVSGPPLLMLPGAALGSLAARFCWQCCQAQHLGASRLVSAGTSRLVSAGRGSTSGSRARFGQHLGAWEPRDSFLLAGAALQVVDGARARFGAPPP